MMANTQLRLFTMSKTIEVTGLDRRTILRLHREGVIRGCKTTKSARAPWRFNAADIERLIDNPELLVA